MTQKPIRTDADLAINGAPPALDFPVHVGRPNVADRDKFMWLVDDILDALSKYKIFADIIFTNIIVINLSDIIIVFIFSSIIYQCVNLI